MNAKSFKVGAAIVACVTILCGCDNAEKERLRRENEKLKLEVDKKRVQEETWNSLEVQLAKQEVAANQAVMDVAAKTADKVKSAYVTHTASIGEAEEVGQKATTSSIRGEMRHGALGGYVLQLWNTTDQPLKCEGVLNNPKLKNAPRYLFVLQPNASKPQELGAGQFHGHRILLDPPCTVTVTIHATGETHTYRP